MQRCGYLTAAARRLLPEGTFPPWIYSSWGSDLYRFGSLNDHIPRIQEVLQGCDYLIADCERDVALAREFGFRGSTLGVLPGGGGFELEKARNLQQPGPVATRRTIAVKGIQRDKFCDGGLIALEAIQQCAEELKGYDIVLYYANHVTEDRAAVIAKEMGLRITSLPYSPHEDILRLMGRSRIAIGLSFSDGTPNTLLEAMIGGAFPIQSDTVSTREWINGENGLLVPPDSPDAIAAAIRRGLLDDKLVDNAAELNARIADQRLERNQIQNKVLEMYRRVAARGKAGTTNNGNSSKSQ